ncbi:MAG: hypothetical protein D6689_14835 [Deltaproteobacteria bacterium]|nr:MAG: hypothetical protein D6689_14835 [Deltaproteobacteria bacterium]
MVERIGGIVAACAAACGNGGGAAGRAVATAPSATAAAPAEANADAAPAPAPPGGAPARESGADAEPPSHAIELSPGHPVTVGGVALALDRVTTAVAIAPDGRGESEVMVATLRVGDATVDLSAGDGDRDTPAAWAGDVRVDLVDIDRDSVRVRASRATGPVVDDRTVTLERRRPSGRDGGVPIGPDVAIARWSHGHKHMRAGGPESPLVVRLRLQRAGQPSWHTVEVNLRPPEERTFTWREYQFELVDFDYGQRMTLRVQRRALVPLRPAGEP